ncbi:hypothetical protein [Sulfuracidifex tepidarius]|nr:hypothetical protein [Sulfuracidifex tepidarius]
MVPLKTSKEIMILVKDSKYSFSIYLLEGENVARIRKDFLPTTLHKVIYEVIDDLKERLSSDLSDLEIARDLDTAKMMEMLNPRRRERKEERKEKAKQKERRSSSALEKLKVNNNVHIFPLLKVGGSFFSIVLETVSGGIFNIPESRPFLIKGEEREPYNVHNLKSIYLLLSQVKIDTFREGNPITDVEIEGGKLTFFSALFLNETEKDEGMKEFTFMGRKAKGLERDYLFFRLSRSGSVRAYTRKAISVAPDLDVGIGFFFWDGKTLVRTGGIDIVKSHEDNMLTLNEYILSASLMISSSLSTYSRAMTGVMNMGISKRIPSHLVKDIMEIDTNPMSISPLVESVSKDEISYYDPVEYWYAVEVLGKDEPCHCNEVSNYVNLRRTALSELIASGWFKDFLI